MEKMIVKVNGKNYEVWAVEATDDCNNKTYSAAVYNNEKRDLRVGVVVWETVEGWSEHRYNPETDGCMVEDCDGSCSDESNACDWTEYSFNLAEYADMAKVEILATMKEIK